MTVLKRGALLEITESDYVLDFSLFDVIVFFFFSANGYFYFVEKLTCERYTHWVEKDESVQ